MKRVHLIISGDVIGVGFRAWVQHYARDASLTGWVKNLPAGEAGREDNAVEVVAEGPQEKLREFVRGCHRGPEVAWVKEVTTTWQKGTGEFTYFEVLY